MEDQIISEQTIIDKVVDVPGSGFGNFGDPGNFKMPSIEEVMKMIDQMEDISEDERESLKSSLVFPDENGAEKLRQQFESVTRAGPSSTDYILFLTMLGLIALVFALFGYKLYKSLMEKERKKQEKQKNNKKSKKSKQK